MLCLTVTMAAVVKNVVKMLLYQINNKTTLIKRENLKTRGQLHDIW